MKRQHKLHTTDLTVIYPQDLEMNLVLSDFLWFGQRASYYDGTQVNIILEPLQAIVEIEIESYDIPLVLYYHQN